MKNGRIAAIGVAWVYTIFVMTNSVTVSVVTIFSLFIPYVLCAIYMITNIEWLKSEGIALRFLVGIMLPLLYESICRIRNLQNGLILLIIVICISSFTDIFAYFTGRRFGNKKLAPNVSPNKSVAGSIGGTTITLVLVLILVKILINPSSFSAYILWGIFILIGSVLGQIGDLEMSAVKRIVDIKDFSNIFPGHGGILDRLDSFLMIVPFSLLWFLILGIEMI